MRTTRNCAAAAASSAAMRAIWGAPSLPVAMNGGVGTAVDTPISATGPRMRR